MHAEPKMHGKGGPHCTAEELLRPLSRHASRSPYCPATLEARTAMRAVTASAGVSFRAANCTLALAWKALNVGSCNENSWAVAERHGSCSGVHFRCKHWQKALVKVPAVPKGRQECRYRHAWPCCEWDQYR